MQMAKFPTNFWIKFHSSIIQVHIYTCIDRNSLQLFAIYYSIFKMIIIIVLMITLHHLICEVDIVPKRKLSMWRQKTTQIQPHRSRLQETWGASMAQWNTKHTKQDYQLHGFCLCYFCFKNTNGHTHTYAAHTYIRDGVRRMENFQNRNYELTNFAHFLEKRHRNQKATKQKLMEQKKRSDVKQRYEFMCKGLHV